MNARKLARGYSKSARQRARWAKDTARKDNFRETVMQATVDILKSLAKRKGLTGYSRMRKADIQAALLA